MKNAATIGLDLAKQVFQVHGEDAEGNKLFNRQLRRSEVLKFFKKAPPCLVGMEACSTSYYWAREIAALGHQVRIIPVVYVKAFVIRGKTDAIDAEAICSAALHKSTRSISPKSAEQQGFTVLLKVRSLFVNQRTKAINALRGHAAEFGLVVPAGVKNVGKLGDLIRTSTAIPEIVSDAFKSILEEIEMLDGRIAQLDDKIANETKRDENIKRLLTIPGVGPNIAAAVKAYSPDVTAFKSSRHFSAWIGLTPLANSSGGSSRVGRIPRAGNSHLRSLLYLAASVIMRWAKPNAVWLQKIIARRPYKVAAIAVANKIARTIWALLKNGGIYRASEGIAIEAS